MVGLELDYAVRTDVGRVRDNNEDAAFASPRMAAVADGVGGAAAGEVASQTVIDAFVALDKTRLKEPLDVALQTAVAQGNQTIAFVTGCRPATAGMSTTLTAVAVDGADYTVVNVGDSRSYLLRDGQLTQLTRDESLVQELVDDGQISPAQARVHPHRSVVMRALDGAPLTDLQVRKLPARVGDRLLLCSDGLSDMVADDILQEALSTASPQACADTLVRLALEAGGQDNVSVIVADLRARDDGAGARA